MVISELQADIEAIERNRALWKETNVDSRAAALDFLEFHVIDRIDGLCQLAGTPEELLRLKQHAQHLKFQLEAIDSTLFQQLRETIRLGQCSGTAFLDLITTYVGYGSVDQQAGPVTDYDTLDVFTNGLFDTQDLPLETRTREPEMVHYQKTPARIIFELAKRTRFTTEDVFYDLGSGLGHVCLLVHLLSGVTSIGVEQEPAYCAYANGCAAALNLPRVVFIQTDARTADYTSGTVFFLYTPFEGQLLQHVLDRLRSESHTRSIRVFTYGPCTQPVSRQSWLVRVDKEDNDIYKLAEFSSQPVG